MPEPASEDRATHTPLNSELAFVSSVLDRYWSLIAMARAAPDSTEPSLGGQLFYAGPLDESGRAFSVAANIAGAATLAVSPDAATQRLAIRDGVVDFVVTTLDEALRILKNQVRKGESVTVCVASTPESVESEMTDRGVAPDLIAEHIPGLLDSAPNPNAPRFDAHAKVVAALPPSAAQATLAWSVPSAPVLWLPRLDAMMIECLDSDAGPDTSPERRWMRLAPRYLGRRSRNLHALRCDPGAAHRFVDRFEVASLRHEFAVPVEVQVIRGDSIDRHRYSPAARPTTPL